MKQYKVFLYETAAVWFFIIFVSFFFGVPLMSELRAKGFQSSEFYFNTLATFLLVALGFVIFCRLKYWFVWMLVLIVLAVLGSGVDPPHRFVFYPDKHSIGDALLTFVSILMFWFIEKLVMIYTGADISHVGQSGNLIEEDEITTLNLENKHRDTKAALDKNYQ